MMNRLFYSTGRPGTGKISSMIENNVLGPWPRQLDISHTISPEEYAALRPRALHFRKEQKLLRRVPLGSDMTLVFESYPLLWIQAHEMVRVEKGGEEQMRDEVAAYSPLVPRGRDIVATLMIDSRYEARREYLLKSLVGVVDHMVLRIGETDVRAEECSQDHVERETEARTSAVHFVRFVPPEGGALLDSLRDAGPRGMRLGVGCSHPKYEHLAMLPVHLVEKILKEDLD